MRHWWLALSLAFLGQSAWAGDAVKVDQSDPQQMIIGLSTSVLAELKARVDELEANPGVLREFTQLNVLPYVDSMRMARHIAGRYWRTATPQQQEDFVEQFTLTILRTYSQSLHKLDVARIDVAAPLPDGDNRVIVPTRVLRENGATADVSYRIFKERDSGNWLIYDVIVEGVSLLLNFRQSYASEIERKGLDQVIEDMKANNKMFL